VVKSVLEDSSLGFRLQADERGHRLKVELQTQQDVQQALADAHAVRHKEFKTFVADNVEPFAEQWDREQRLQPAAGV